MAVYEGKIIFGRRRVMNMIFVVLSGYVTLCLFMFLNQRDFIYFPDRSKADRVAAGVPSMEVVVVQPDNMKDAIEGWYKSPSDPEKPVIVYFHGNGGSIEIRGNRANYFMDAGYGVLLAEYRGYGGNPGEPSENGLYADAAAYMDWLLTAEKVPADKIVVYGESLGTAVATWTAQKYPDIGGVILDSPFTSMTDLARSRYFFVPVDLLLRDRFPSVSRIADLKQPKLFLQAKTDFIVPPRYGARLFDAAVDPKKLEVLPNAGHSNILEEGGGPLVLEFLDQLP